MTRSHKLACSTVQAIKRAVTYDPLTGVLTRVYSANGRGCGAIRGNQGPSGALVARVFGTTYSLHRIAWLVHTGEQPRLIGHIDGDKTNNKWNNLREMTASEVREKQTKPSSNNKVGFLGVTRYRGKFKAVIESQGRSKYLGLFETAEEASKAYQIEKVKRYNHRSEAKQ